MNSPRLRYHITLPERSPAPMNGLAYLALLIVAVNVLACLIAERSMHLAANAGNDPAVLRSAIRPHGTASSEALPPIEKLAPLELYGPTRR